MSWKKSFLVVNGLAERRNKSLLLFLGIILGIAGCCGETALERDYGNSWAYNEEVQIANPQASLTETPATGLSPAASVTAMGAYNKSFGGKKAGGSSTTINLGGLTTSPATSGGGGGGN